LICAAFVLVAASPAFAQMTGAPAAGYKLEPGMSSSQIPEALKGIGFDQHLNERVPLDAAFTDETGRQVRLGDYFGKRPVVLVFAYYECPMLCTMALNGLGSALNVLSLEPGNDFEIVTISFDPRDTPASASAKKTQYIARYKHPRAPEAWHFLTGDQASIERVTKAAGFRYVWDADTKQFAHPTGVIVLTPDGRLARYLFGVEYGPRDLRYALVEASDGKVGSRVDTLLLYCFHYDPMTGRYGLVIMRAIRLAGAATVLALCSFIIVMVKREKRRGSGLRARGSSGGSATIHQPPATSYQPPATGL
jgi:protein SCO1/2